LGLLLLLLLATYLLSAFTSGGWVSLIQILFFSVAAVLTLQASRMRPRTVHLILGFGLVGTVFFALLALIRVNQFSDGIANVWAGLVLLLTAAVIVRLVLTMGTVTMQSIYGAVSAYMILGLMFAAFYSAMYHFGGEFFAAGRHGTTQTFQYFSFTTLTTLGYGDYTAAQSSGQAVAVIEALVGQVFLATLVARLVASFRVTDTPQSTPTTPTAPSATRTAPPSARTAPPPASPAPPPTPRTGPPPTRSAPPRGRQNAGIDHHGTVAAKRGTSPARPKSAAPDRPPPGRPDTSD
jgi:hypothetical protein